MPVFRIIVYMLLAIFLISLVRGVIGIFMKGLAELGAPPQQKRARHGPRSPDLPLTGELKRDPVCGTYTSVATSVKQIVGKETVYFCSSQCRDKYVASR